MFEKEQLKEYLKKLEIDKKKYCLMAGGSLVLHGIKEKTEDIDLYVSKEGFETLQR